MSEQLLNLIFKLPTRKKKFMLPHHNYDYRPFNYSIRFKSLEIQPFSKDLHQSTSMNFLLGTDRR